jgi:hypothetical protein
MATHTSIKNYLNEDWLFNLIDQCRTIAWQNKEVECSKNYFKKINDNLELLPIEYACDHNKKPEFLKQVNKVLSYKCNIDKPLTKDCDNLFISDCSIEIHLDKDRIIDIIIVA